MSENIGTIRKTEIECDPLLDGMSCALRDETTKQVLGLYAASREIVAPVITGFADNLLREARGRKIVFAARDGLATYLAAKVLKEKFDPLNADPDQLVYAYLTRNVLAASSDRVVSEHLQQLGVDTSDDVLLADIGMYGSFIPSIRKILPNVNARYLISRTPNVPGYADGSKKETHRMVKSMATIVGNTAVHFLEDTFSGPIPSPMKLVDQGGVWTPDTKNDGYPLDIAMRRKYALLGVQDYVRSLSEPPVQPNYPAIDRLDLFLSEPSNYRDIMVPHER